MRLDDQDSKHALPHTLTQAQFDNLASIAERLAATLDARADLHDELVDRLPDAAAHSARERRLAAAERAAAAAYRNRELPSDDVRRIIRGDGDAAGQPTGTPRS